MIYLISLILAVIWHVALKRIWLANIGAAISSTCLTLLFAMGVSYNIYGEQFLIDLVKTFIIAFMVSVLVGSVFVSIRKKTSNENIS